MANKYECSNGEKVTEATIKSRLSAAYKKWYAGEPHPNCEGCGDSAQGTAHFLPKSICKQLHKTELIWTRKNTFPACHKCNAIAENPESEDIKKLNNYETILAITKEYDFERYQKMIL